MTIKLSLQEAQDIYQKSNNIRREKEYLRSAMQRVKDMLEDGLAAGAVGEKAVRECLGVLKDALGVTGDVNQTAGPGMIRTLSAATGAGRNCRVQARYRLIGPVNPILWKGSFGTGYLRYSRLYEEICGRLGEGDKGLLAEFDFTGEFLAAFDADNAYISGLC